MKKGFTLVELLAAIVILAIILVIAVPKVIEVIRQTKYGSMQSSVKLIARGAENKRLQDTAFGETSPITCEAISEYSEDDYGPCSISFNNNIATVTLVGKGKFEGITCVGTKDAVMCSNSVSEWVYALDKITSPNDGVEDYNALNSDTFIRYPKNVTTYENTLGIAICIVLSNNLNCFTSNYNVEKSHMISAFNNNL